MRAESDTSNAGMKQPGGSEIIFPYSHVSGLIWRFSKIQGTLLGVAMIGSTLGSPYYLIPETSHIVFSRLYPPKLVRLFVSVYEDFEDCSLVIRFIWPVPEWSIFVDISGVLQRGLWTSRLPHVLRCETAHMIQVYAVGVHWHGRRFLGAVEHAVSSLWPSLVEVHHPHGLRPGTVDTGDGGRRS